MDVELLQGGKRVDLRALVDTGNTLTDPISGRTVLVAEGERVTRLLPPECRPEPEDLLDPAGAILRLGQGKNRGKYRLLPYRTVGTERGFLLAVYVEGCRIAGENAGKTLVALSPTPVSDGGNYCALIGAR